MAMEMETTIETPRLRLTRLTNTDLDSEHLQWFHELWTDPAATSWSLHGPCKTLPESREWMQKQLDKTGYDNMLYAVHAKPIDLEQPASASQLIGSIGLKSTGEAILPPLPPPAATPFTTNTTFNLRHLGYSFFESAWGKGYATEACSGILACYTAFRARTREGREERGMKGELYYVEAQVHVDNPASMKVLEKVGLKGRWMEQEEKVFLAGRWREGQCWIYGMYV